MEREGIRRLIDLMAIDDARAFKEFFDVMYGRLFRLAFYYVRSDELCEELVSDVFMKIWNNRKKLPGIDHLEFYFFKSIKNQACTYLKRELRWRFEDTESVKSFKLEYAEPENLFIAKEMACAVEAAISGLPDKCQMIFRLIREDGMTYKGVAELLDISLKTVENQMTIAVKKLKCALDEYYQKGVLSKPVIPNAFLN